MSSEGHGLHPPGEPLRRALLWLDQRKREEPTVPLYKLIDEAALRFDLTPPESDFLLRNWRPNGGPDPQP